MGTRQQLLVICDGSFGGGRKAGGGCGVEKGKYSLISSWLSMRSSSPPPAPLMAHSISLCPLVCETNGSQWVGNKGGGGVTSAHMWGDCYYQLPADNQSATGPCERRGHPSSGVVSSAKHHQKPSPLICVEQILSDQLRQREEAFLESTFGFFLPIIYSRPC